MRTHLYGLLAAALAAVALLPTAAPADPPPVRLQVAYGQTYAVSGMTFSWTSIQVKVQNIAYEKAVTLHYHDPSDGTWKDHPLTFQGHYGNYDVFGGGGTTPVTDEFAIRFAVPGQEHWDNNDRANYHVGTFAGTVGGRVALKEAKARIGAEAGGGFVFTTSWFEGEIFVENLSYHKIVGVRWSSDGGSTWQNTNATYAGKLTAVAAEVPSVEIWRFKTPTYNLSNASTPFRFAVFYEQRDSAGDATVATFWDNNFTQDYSLAKADGTTIR